MTWIAVLLWTAQASPPPADADPYAAMREKMAQSIVQQKQSVRKQAAAVHRTPETEDSFYTVPWPREATTPVAFAAPPPCDPIAPRHLAPIITSAASRHGLPELLVDSVIRKESAHYPCAVSTAGAMGLMQLMPETAASLGVHDPFDAEQNVEGGTRFLRSLLDRFGGNVGLALGAYNAGPHRIEQYGGLPPFRETQDYVSTILNRLNGKQAPGTPAPAIPLASLSDTAISDISGQP